MNKKARLIAFYLPQFHPIFENDEWWGSGHTEWRVTSKSKPLYHKHYQPHIPLDLGYYDLRLADSRAKQANLAKNHGIEGFCYWHYWFSGKQLLETPFEEVLRTGDPDFPFCLGWANHSWDSIRTFGMNGKVLIKQEYPGIEDHEKHFYHLLRAFLDDRYIKVNGKPFFLVLRPADIPNIKNVTDHWRNLAVKEGLKGLHLVTVDIPTEKLAEYGFDATTSSKLREVREHLSLFKKYYLYCRLLNFNRVEVYKYSDAIKYFLRGVSRSNFEYPCVIPNWDNSPRANQSAYILHGSTPELFREHLCEALNLVYEKPFEHRVIMIKSWNEWAEGNYLEPEITFGTKYLQVVKEEVLINIKINESKNFVGI